MRRRAAPAGCSGAQDLAHPLGLRGFAYDEFPVNSARATWVREPIPSLRNTFCRCYSTVLGLMNNRVAISRLARPSATSWAIWDSCGVSPQPSTGSRKRYL
jgi:hypothetical protein